MTAFNGFFFSVEIYVLLYFYETRDESEREGCALKNPPPCLAMFYVRHFVFPHLQSSKELNSHTVIDAFYRLRRKANLNPKKCNPKICF